MADEFQILLILNHKFVVNLKALDRAEGSVQRFRALRALFTTPLTPPPQKAKDYVIDSS